MDSQRGEKKKNNDYDVRYCTLQLMISVNYYDNKKQKMYEK